MNPLDQWLRWQLRTSTNVISLRVRWIETPPGLRISGGADAGNGGERL